MANLGARYFACSLRILVFLSTRIIIFVESDETQELCLELGGTTFLCSHDRHGCLDGSLQGEAPACPHGLVACCCDRDGTCSDGDDDWCCKLMASSYMNDEFANASGNADLGAGVGNGVGATVRTTCEDERPDVCQMMSSSNSAKYHLSEIVTMRWIEHRRFDLHITGNMSSITLPYRRIAISPGHSDRTTQMVTSDTSFERRLPQVDWKGSHVTEAQVQHCVETQVDRHNLNTCYVDRNFSVEVAKGSTDVVLVENDDALALWEGIIVRPRSRSMLTTRKARTVLAHVGGLPISAYERKQMSEQEILRLPLFLIDVLRLFSHFNFKASSLSDEIRFFSKYAWDTQYAVHVFPRLVAMLQPFTINYFHWTAGVLPYLCLLATSEFSADPVLVYPTNFAREAVRVLNISNPIFYEPNCVYFANSLRHYEGGTGLNYDVNSRVNMLTARNSVLNALDLRDTQSIQSARMALLISRKDSRVGSRQILNEDDVLRTIQDRVAPSPAQAVQQSLLPWNSQVRMIASASVLAGVEGAGLSNLIYMPLESLVIIIQPGSFGEKKSNYGPHLTSCGFSYYWHLSQSVGLQSRTLIVPVESSAWHANVTVPVRELSKILDDFAWRSSL